ncbi:MAG: hypothetical protein M3081_05445 [Gemmatimonadota bacterium]|nr:hypothetical protein [Gemmatimonadota bacterium]
MLARSRHSLGILAVLLFAAAPLVAQVDTTTPPTADPADVASVDAIIKTLYDVISGPAGQARNWNRFRSLFVPGARLIPTGLRQGGGAMARVWTPEEYATRAGANLEKNGFFEREISRHADAYGNIMQIFSTYESRRTAEDPTPFARGINSIQLLKDAGRWWVVTIYWDSERPDNPIPTQFLPR